MISYAQNFEDVYLGRAFARQPSGFYIDVGAMDPVVDSVTKHFYDAGWRGINVEPVPHLFQRFERLRPRDINLNVAVGGQIGRANFYWVVDTGLSTLDGDLAQGYRLERHTVRVIDVPVVTLGELCRTWVTGDIDFLKIDAEGAEGAILGGGDWMRFRPRIVIAEATRCGSVESCSDEWEPTLLGHGYLFALFDGLNRYYVRHEDRRLCEAFRLPPNVFDGFILYSMASGNTAMAELTRSNVMLTKELDDLRRRVTYLEEELAPVPSLLQTAHQYTYGTIIDFAIGGNARKHELFGWFCPEETHTWMKGPESGLLFQTEPPRHDLVITLDLLPFVAGERLARQRLEVEVNGVGAGSWDLAGPEVLSVRVPKMVWEARRVAEVRLLHPDAQPPRVLSAGQDDRGLSVGLKRLIISYAREAEDGQGTPG